jgi:hypothetical protein
MMKNPFVVEKPRNGAELRPVSSEICNMSMPELTESQYRALPRIANSDLKEFKRSPLHYYHYKNVRRDPTPAQFEGTVIHSMVLEPGTFKDEYMVMDLEDRPEPNKTMASEENKAWKASLENEAESTGKQIVEHDLYLKAQDIANNLNRSQFVNDLLYRTKKEQSFTWEADGIQYKCRADMWNEGIVADLKTTLNAKPSAFERDIFKYQYYRQGAMYAHGTHSKDFYFIAVEKNPPFGYSIHKLSDEVIAYGQKEYRNLGLQLNECLQTGIFPGYPCHNEECSNEVFLPPYLNNDDE